LFPALYAIIDLNSSQEIEAALSLSQKIAAGGARLMQTRAKDHSAREYFLAAQKFLEILAPLGVKLIVNDRPDVAAIATAQGVHVGQQDLPPDLARKLCPPPLWVGVSTHNLDQLKVADKTSADYIAFGPVFPTQSKANPDPVVGLELLRQARNSTRKPLVAIGGITVESAAAVFAAGADSVAVISDLSEAPDPAARAAQYLEIARKHAERALYAERN
jgi:thiamine-phosphate pyrophosphorylase